MSEEFEEGGEVLIREIEFNSKNQAPYDSIPSQWTLSQHDERSPSFPSPKRKERVQRERNGLNSSQSESDTSLSHENDFANLEALLEDQQNVRANCAKNDATITDNDNCPIGSKAKCLNADPDEHPLTCSENVRNASYDDVVNNNLIAANDVVEHPSKRQSTVRLRSDTGTSEPSRTTAYANHSSLDDQASRRLHNSYPTAMVSSLLDSTSLNHSSILEKSRKMASQNRKQRTPHVIQERRSNATRSSITGTRYVGIVEQGRDVKA